MKKINYLLLIALGMVFYSSCSNTEVSEEPGQTKQTAEYNSESQELIDFQMKLEALNEQTFTSNTSTRGFKSFWKKFVAVVISDALGGGIGFAAGGPAGAAVGAITSSASAAITPIEKIDMFTRAENNYSVGKPMMNDPKIALSSNLIPSASYKLQGPAIEDSIGYYHNLVLISLNKDLASRNTNLDTIIGKVAELTCKSYHTTEKTIINQLKSNKSFYEELTSNVIPNISQNDNLSSIIFRFQEQYPEQKEMLNTLKLFFQGLSNVEVTDNNGDYLNKALALLDSTVKDPITKRDVRNALIVANASYQLWDSSDK